jgi:Uma2 family endonuclease
MVGTLISVDEYLHTMYHPDCDYVDGEIIERNIGEKSHGNLQFEIAFVFRMRRYQWNAFAFIEQRVQVSPTRFRIPEVCVYIGGEPEDEVFHVPPFICIEIRSPEDRLGRIQDRIDDYLSSASPMCGRSIHGLDALGPIQKMAAAK